MNHCLPMAPVQPERRRSPAFIPVTIKLDRRFVSVFDTSYVNDAQLPLTQPYRDFGGANKILILI
jgi:hypothetical protein